MTSKWTAVSLRLLAVRSTSFMARLQRAGFSHPRTRASSLPFPLAARSRAIISLAPATATASSSSPPCRCLSQRRLRRIDVLPTQSPQPQACWRPGRLSSLAEPVLTTTERQALRRRVTAAGLKRDVERYSGARPVSGTSTIRSRHIHHTGNASAVGALVDDLSRLGGGRLTVNTHRFSHEGRPYDNVEATLSTAGLDGIILVTAHMDSTGARLAGYRASVDPAPGADDDASGVAGVLAACRALLVSMQPWAFHAEKCASSCSTPRSMAWSEVEPMLVSNPFSPPGLWLSFRWT